MASGLQTPSRTTPKDNSGTFSAGSESEAAASFFSDGSSSTRRTGRNSTTATLSFHLRSQYSPSLINALRIAGISDQYLRGLLGLRSRFSAPSTGSSQPQQYYDVLEGVSEFLDDKDYPATEKNHGSSSSGGLSSNRDPTTTANIAEICHI